MTTLRGLAFLATINTIAVLAIHVYLDRYALFYSFGFWEWVVLLWPWLLLVVLAVWVGVEKPRER